MLFEQINQNLSIQRFQAVYNYLDFRAAFEKKRAIKCSLRIWSLRERNKKEVELFD